MRGEQASTPGLKWGHPDYKDKPVDREPEEAEIMHVLAEYTQTGSISKAAQRVNLPEPVVMKIVSDAVKHNPAMLDTGEPELWIGITLREISIMAIEQAKKNMKDMKTDKLVKTAAFAADRARSFHQSYKEKQGLGEVDLGDADAIAEEVEDARRQLEALRNATADAPTETHTQGTGDTPEGTLGKDAEGR